MKSRLKDFSWLVIGMLLILQMMAFGLQSLVLIHSIYNFFYEDDISLQNINKYRVD